MRTMRYMLQMNSANVADICLSVGCLVTKDEIHDFLRNEEDPLYQPCPEEVAAYFLDGLIQLKRGKDESRPVPPIELPFSNNLVVKKLRVAFQLREEDILALIQSTGFEFGKAQLSAILRKKGHPNYRECQDQVLRYFLKGLTTRLKVAST